MVSELNRDAEIKALIRSALLDARRITLTDAGSRVILTGTGRSWVERQEAERVACSTLAPRRTP